MKTFLLLAADIALDSGHSLTVIKERRLRQVIEIIDSDPASSVGDLAEKVSLSPAHLQRLFKRHTGMQLGFLITEWRLQKAAELLMSTNLSIKEVAHQVGYQHHSSFVRAFERRFAQPPKLYRNQLDSASKRQGMAGTS